MSLLHRLSDPGVRPLPRQGRTSRIARRVPKGSRCTVDVLCSANGFFIGVIHKDPVFQVNLVFMGTCRKILRANFAYRPFFRSRGYLGLGLFATVFSIPWILSGVSVAG